MVICAAMSYRLSRSRCVDHNTSISNTTSAAGAATMPATATRATRSAAAVRAEAQDNYREDKGGRDQGHRNWLPAEKATGDQGNVGSRAVGFSSGGAQPAPTKRQTKRDCQQA
jgi:hypothetical protein